MSLLNILWGIDGMTVTMSDLEEELLSLLTVGIGTWGMYLMVWAGLALALVIILEINTSL